MGYSANFLHGRIDGYPAQTLDPLAHHLSLVVDASLASRPTALPLSRLVGRSLMIKRGVSQADAPLDMK